MITKMPIAFFDFFTEKETTINKEIKHTIILILLVAIVPAYVRTVSLNTSSPSTYNCVPNPVTTGDRGDRNDSPNLRALLADPAGEEKT